MSRRATAVIIGSICWGVPASANINVELRPKVGGAYPYSRYVNILVRAVSSPVTIPLSEHTQRSAGTDGSNGKDGER